MYSLHHNRKSVRLRRQLHLAVGVPHDELVHLRAATSAGRSGRLGDTRAEHRLVLLHHTARRDGKLDGILVAGAEQPGGASVVLLATGGISPD